VLGQWAIKTPKSGLLPPGRKVVKNVEGGGALAPQMLNIAPQKYASYTKRQNY